MPQKDYDYLRFNIIPTIYSYNANNRSFEAFKVRIAKTQESSRIYLRKSPTLKQSFDVGLVY